MYFAPISSKIKLIDATKLRIKQTRNRKQCVSRHWINEEARRLRTIDSIKEIGIYTSPECNYVTF